MGTIECSSCFATPRGQATPVIASERVYTSYIHTDVEVTVATRKKKKLSGMTDSEVVAVVDEVESQARDRARWRETASSKERQPERDQWVEQNPEGTPKTGQRGTHQNRPMVSGGR
jgi:hypothetical protein